MEPHEVPPSGNALVATGLNQLNKHRHEHVVNDQLK